ncbi:BrnA antitoxin family protein [Rhizobium sp. L1K21]|uniref:BrnA antitoxin family protein n=1 Tax=Rhizobium sp. L1K21 TaxID=2954933 RepID=UPI002092CE5B|nr:BrnA antitoxin family protein [Rhizobium sp. L1K21]MCO6185518.1 BrnA antitoxin family protein [Rhizobium sp. L1K21]
MSGKVTARFSLDEIREKRARGEDKTDWSVVDSMDDDSIERAIQSDPDWADMNAVDWSKADIVVPMGKRSISIRLDADVIAFFKAGGKGYQTRINAVLRHYMKESGSSGR